MTDQQTYTKDDGTVLLEIRPDWRSAKNGKLLLKLPIVSDHDSVVIPATELLAMIDTIDPEAMRAYLRERSDLIDGPGEPLTVNGANMTAEQAVYADVPEGDPLDALGMVTEARMLIETADQHLRGLDGALDASQMISNASDRLRHAITALVPEADSPEDVAERPAPATTERLALLGQIRDLYPNLPPSRHIGVVHWLLEGTVLIERVERLLDRSAR
ncbi:hypothetical protein [Brachybacterium tyrofermentans]|uniref:hypothetical protein n=1 Tax=Brachybacterium tyrofermentans TaxID=47848 RepID=UPI003FD60829